MDKKCIYFVTMSDEHTVVYLLFCFKIPHERTLCPTAEITIHNAHVLKFNCFAKYAFFFFLLNIYYFSINMFGMAYNQSSNQYMFRY